MDPVLASVYLYIRRLTFFLCRLRQLIGVEDFGGNDLRQQLCKLRLSFYGRFEYPQEFQQIAGTFRPSSVRDVCRLAETNFGLLGFSSSSQARP